MVDTVNGGVLINEGGYWTSKEDKQRQSLETHYTRLYDGSVAETTRQQNAKDLWVQIVNNEAGAFNTDILYGALAEAPLTDNQNIEGFCKLLGGSKVVQDEVLADIFSDAAAIKRRQQYTATYFQAQAITTDATGANSKELFVSSGNKGLNDFTPQINASVEKARKSLMQAFTNPQFALNLFQNNPKFIERYSANSLLGFALSNSGAAFSIFVDATLAAKVAPQINKDDVAQLIAQISSIKDHASAAKAFQGLFIHVFKDREAIAPLIESGLLKSAASSEIAPAAFAESKAGQKDKTKWAAIANIRSYFYREAYNPDKIDPPLGSYLQQHPDVVVELCGGKDALNLARLQQLINLHSDPVGFVSALAQHSALTNFIGTNLFAIASQVKTNVKKYADHTGLSADNEYQRLDAFLGNPSLVAKYCSQFNTAEVALEKLLQLTDLSKDPVGFVLVLAKNSATRKLITDNIGDIVLHLQDRLGQTLSAKQIKKQLGKLLDTKIGTKIEYTDERGAKQTGYTLKRCLSNNMKAALRSTDAAVITRYAAQFASDSIRGYVNLDSDTCFAFVDSAHSDPTICFTMASDSNIWKKIVTGQIINGFPRAKEQGQLEARSPYFAARLLLDTPGGLDYKALMTSEYKDEICALIAARPYLFSKINQPAGVSWFSRLFHLSETKTQIRDEFKAFIRNNRYLKSRFSKDGSLKLISDEDTDLVHFSRTFIDDAQKPSFFTGDTNDVLKHAICEGASPKELLAILVSDASGALIKYITTAGNERYFNKMLRNGDKEWAEFAGNVRTLPSVLNYFDATGKCLVPAQEQLLINKTAALVTSTFVSILEQNLDKVFKIATTAADAGNESLLLAVLNRSISDSAYWYKALQEPGSPTNVLHKQLLTKIFAKLSSLTDVGSIAAFNTFVKYFIKQDSWLAEDIFTTVSAERLYSIVQEDISVLGILCNKLTTFHQEAKLLNVIGRFEYEDLVSHAQAIKAALADKDISDLSLEGLLHFFDGSGTFFDNEAIDLKHSISTVIQQKIAAAPACTYGQFRKLFVLFTDDNDFVNTVYAKFATNWQGILDLTTADQDRITLQEKTKELLLANSAAGVAFRKNVSVAVLTRLYDLDTAHSITQQDWQNIFKALWLDGNKAALLLLWQQNKSDLVKHFAFNDWASLNSGADFRTFIANLSLSQLLSVFGANGQALEGYTLGNAAAIIVNKIAEKIAAGDAQTVPLVDLEKASKLSGINAAALMKFYVPNWGQYQTASASANSTFTASLFAANNALGEAFRKAATVECLQSMTATQLEASIKLSWKDKPELVKEYLSQMTAFDGVQAASAALKILIKDTEYSAGVTTLADVLRFFDDKGVFFCDDVTAKNKVIAKVQLLLPTQLESINTKQAQQLLALKVTEITSQLQAWATKSWQVFSALPAKLCAEIISNGIEKQADLVVRFVRNNYEGFIERICSGDTDFADSLSAQAYAGLLLEAANANDTVSLKELLSFIKTNNKYEALLLLLHTKGAEFVQAAGNFAVFKPLLSGNGLKVLESDVEAADLLKFFDTSGAVNTRFTAVLDSTKLVAKIISTGSFAFQVEQQLVQADVTASASKSRSPTANKGRNTSSTATVVLSAQAQKNAEMDEKIAKRNAAEAAARKRELQQLMGKNKSAFGKASQAISRTVQSISGTVQSGSSSSSANSTAHTSSSRPSPSGAVVRTADTQKVKLTFAKAEAILDLALTNIENLELAIANLMIVLPKCNGTGDALGSCKTKLANLLSANSHVIPGIIFALRSLEVPDQLKMIRLLDTPIAKFLNDLTSSTIGIAQELDADIVTVLSYFLRFAFDSQVKGGLPQGTILRAITAFFAKYGKYYDEVITAASDEVLLLMMRKNYAVFSKAIEAEKVSPENLAKIFARLDVLEASSANALITSIAKQYDAGLLFFGSLDRLSKYKNIFIKAWWTKNAQEFMRNISHQDEKINVALKSLLGFKEDIGVTQTVFASADGVLKCISILSATELAKYTKELLVVLPQPATGPQQTTSSRQAPPSQTVGGLMGEMASKLAARQSESAASEVKSTLVVTPEQRGQFVAGLTKEFVQKMLQIPETSQIAQRLCCFDVRTLLLVLNCAAQNSSEAKNAIVAQKTGIKTLINKQGADLSGFGKQHWTALIEGGVSVSLAIYQDQNKVIEGFLFGNDSSDALKIATITVCPEFFMVDGTKKTIGGFALSRFSDAQLKTLLRTLPENHQAVLVSIITADRPQLISDLFDESSSGDIDRQWNVFKNWLTQQLNSHVLTQAQITKLLACTNASIKTWLGSVYAVQPQLVADAFNEQTRTSIIGNEAFFLPYLHALAAQNNITGEVVAKCLGARDDATQTWLTSLYTTFPHVISALLASLEATKIQNNYYLFKPILVAAAQANSTIAIDNAQLAKLFGTDGRCYDEAQQDVVALFKTRPAILQAFIISKFDDASFSTGFIAQNNALINELLPQLTEATAIKALIKYGDADIWQKVFSNQEKFNIVASNLNLLEDKHYVEMLKCIVQGSADFILQNSTVKNACKALLTNWCSDFGATLTDAQVQILRGCFNNKEAAFFDDLTLKQFSILAKIGDKDVVDKLWAKKGTQIGQQFFNADNAQQLKVLADTNPVFAKSVFEHGVTDKAVFEAAFITGRDETYKQQKFGQWLNAAINGSNVDKNALNILLKVQKDSLLAGAYYQLPIASKNKLNSIYPSFAACITNVSTPSSTALAMRQLTTTDFVDVSEVLKNKEESQWQVLLKNDVFLANLKQEFSSLVTRNSHSTDSLSRLVEFLGNKFACTVLDPYLLLRSIAAVANAKQAHSGGGVWENIRETVGHLKASNSVSTSIVNPVITAFVNYAEPIIQAKLKEQASIVEQHQVLVS